MRTGRSPRDASFFANLAYDASSVFSFSKGTRYALNSRQISQLRLPPRPGASVQIDRLRSDAPRIATARDGEALAPLHIVDELREVFEIGTDEYDVAHVAGVGPRAEWRTKEGRLFSQCARKSQLRRGSTMHAKQLAQNIAHNIVNDLKRRPDWPLVASLIAAELNAAESNFLRRDDGWQRLSSRSDSSDSKRKEPKHP